MEIFEVLLGAALVYGLYRYYKKLKARDTANSGGGGGGKIDEPPRRQQ